MLPPRDVSDTKFTNDDEVASLWEKLERGAVIEEDTSLFSVRDVAEDCGMVDVTAAMLVGMVGVCKEALGASDELVPLRKDSS